MGRGRVEPRHAASSSSGPESGTCASAAPVAGFVTSDDARAEVARMIEMVECACAIPTTTQGRILEDVARGLDCETVRGVCAGVVGLVNGGREIVEGILVHPGIDAVSFVGSAPVAKIVYEGAAKAGASRRSAAPSLSSMAARRPVGLIRAARTSARRSLTT